jgi:hypothetical protein
MGILSDSTLTKNTSRSLKSEMVLNSHLLVTAALSAMARILISKSHSTTGQSFEQVVVVFDDNMTEEKKKLGLQTAEGMLVGEHG